jgi:hypothetical protein
MAVVLLYKCTVAKRIPLLCENFNLLSLRKRAPVSPAGAQRFTVNHTPKRKKRTQVIVQLCK